MQIQPRTYLLRLIALGLLVLAAAFATACHQPYESGLEALASGRYADAQRNAREGLDENPDDPALNLLLADALVGEQKYREAEVYARKAWRSGADRAHAGRTLGKILWELGDAVEAVEIWREARDADPDSVSDEDYLAALETALAVAMSKHEFEDAIAFRRQIGTMKPDHPETGEAEIRATREKMAKSLVMDARYVEAIDVYGQLAADYPDEASYVLEKGRLLAQLGEREEARTAFDDYVERGPEDERASRAEEVASRAERLGAFDVAAEFYREAIESLEDRPTIRRAKLHLKLGGLLLSLRSEKAGRKHLRAYVDHMRQIRGLPLAALVYLKAAQTATQNRHPQVALDLLEEAIEKAAPSWRATRMLAELYARRARSRDVERVLKRYIERAESKTMARMQAGRWAAGRRDFDLARFFLEEAVNDEGVTADVWLELARVYSALGLMGDVRRALATYTDEADDRRRALIDVSQIYRGQRMYEEAEEALLKALRDDSTDLMVVKQLETIYREWGRPKKIHDVYDRWAEARGNKPEDLALIGERFFRQNEWDDALPYLKRAAGAGETDAWLQVADIYKRQRKERDMKRALDRYLDAADDRARALNDVWQRYHTSNWRHEAIPFLEELIYLEPRNVLHYEQLSQLYFEQGRDVEAFELWKKYIDMSQNPIAALEAMSMRFQTRGHHDWMLTFLHQVLEKKDDPDPRIYKLLGDAYYTLINRRRGARFALGRHSIFSERNKAKEYYDLYLEKANPTRPEIQVFADSMRQKRIWDVAARAYEQLDLSSAAQTHQLLNYGAVLLHLGQAQRAEEIFAQYYDRRGESVDAARAVADELFRARRYTAVEPYLRKMMEAGDENLLRNAFMLMAEVYRNSDRTDDIPELVSDYLNTTQNPSEARRTILQVLKNAGMWEESVRQLERMTELQGEEFAYDLAVHLYRAGERDRAIDVFRRFAGNAVNPGQAWARVARFHEDHGNIEQASTAYRKAVAAASTGGDQLLADRGRFRILTGRIEDGRRDFEEARSRVPHARKGPLWRIEVEALLDAGRFKLARQAARKAVSVAYVDKDLFFRVIANAEFASGDPVRSQRMVDELKTTGLPVDTIVDLLVRHGNLEKAAELIEEELQTGDVIVGGNLVLEYTDIFTRLGGMDRLMRTIQPLLDRDHRGSNLTGQLGEYLVREGEYDQGVIFLRAAVDRGEQTYRPLLAYTYALLGHHQEAMRLFQAHLAASSENLRGPLLQSIAIQYELLGEKDRMEALLEHLARDERFAGDAIPLLIQYMVHDGRVSAAVATLEQLWKTELESPEAAALTLAEDQSGLAAEILVSGVEILAGEGFVQEGMSLLRSAPRPVREDETVRDLRLRLATFTEELGTRQEVNRALESLGSSNEENLQTLKLAQLLTLGGRFELAGEIAEGMLDSPNFEVAREALKTLIYNARASGDVEDIDDWVEEFVAAASDKLSARSDAGTYLRNIGLDDKMLELLAENARRVPTENNLTHAVIAAQRSGDVARVENLAGRIAEVGDTPLNSMKHYTRSWLARQSSELTEPFLRRYRDGREGVLDGLEFEVRLRYRSGHPEEARVKLLGYLEAVRYEPQAVQWALELLESYGLRGDMARVIGPKIDPETATVESLRLLGQANLILGFEEEGEELLELHLERSADAAHAATRLADSLVSAGKYEHAHRYAQRSVDLKPGRPEGYLVRGLARLALGKVASAEGDLDRGLSAGLNRQLALYRAGKIALEVGEIELANQFLADLAMAPSARMERPMGPLVLVLEAYNSTGHAREGVAFLESLRPDVVSGLGVAGDYMTQYLAGLFENAGMEESAYDLYRTAIRRRHIRAPFSAEVPTFQNNLAYTFSTTNRHVEEGIARVLNAMSTNDTREASYIDTLGWLYYRQGRLEDAEREIRRSLRSSTQGDTELIELYEHLAEIREARGDHRSAVWIRIFVDGLEGN